MIPDFKITIVNAKTSVDTPVIFPAYLCPTAGYDRESPIYFTHL